MSLVQPNAPTWVQTAGYDGANRLQILVSPAGTFTYGYQNAATLINKITLPGGAYVTNAFDNVARLTSTSLKTSGHALLNLHSYLLNDASQRTRQTRVDGSYVDYGYDDIGQLKTAVGREPGGSVRLHENLGYGYDLAGNLNYRTNNALVQTFNNNNSLNELSTVTRNTSLTVAGSTTSTASSVTVNGSSATLYGDNTFARSGISLVDGTNTITAIASDSLGRSDTNVVTANLPASSTYQYDANGNLTFDGTRYFMYDWDDRLVAVEVRYNWIVTFAYDGLGRLIQRRYWTNNQNNQYVPAGEVRYIYNGSLVIQERDGNNVPQVTYTRGLDLSTTCCDAAGGIGGLLARTDNSTQASGVGDPHAYYHSDGNGNVTMLIDSSQRPVAKYLYDPYGNTIAKSGALADANTHRFSSKRFDEKTGLYHFGRRFYDPSLQRWPNRDPSGIAGGINLYGYVGNGPVNLFDPWGLDFWFTDEQTVAMRYGFIRYADATAYSLIGANATAGGKMPGIGGEGESVWGNMFSAPDEFLSLTISGEDLLAAKEAYEAAHPPSEPPIELRDPNSYNALLIGAPNLVGMGVGEDMADLNGAVITAAAGGVGGGGVEPSKGAFGSLTPSEVRQIQSFADKFEVEVNVVGSRAAGTAGPGADYDYVIGGSARVRHSAEYFLPRGPRGTGSGRGIDIFRPPLLPGRPSIPFKPRPPIKIKTGPERRP